MESEAVRIATEMSVEFEGFYPRPYLCPAGVPTIGFGTTVYRNGHRVTLTDPPITRSEALDELLYELEHKLPSVIFACPGADTAERLGALLDFTYNLGIGRLRASTLRKRVNEQDWPASVYEIKRWVFAAGKKLRGLVLRREAEAKLLESGDGSD